MREILDALPAGSPEWHEQRRFRVGGSEVAAILGLSPWESAFSLWHRKAGNVPFDPMDDNEALYWGRVHEPAIRAEFAKRHADTHHEDHEIGLVVALDGFALASPDSVVSRKGADWGVECEVLEIKTDRFGDGWGEPGTDQIPIQYVCQAQWYMGVLGLPLARFAVLVGGAEYREYVLPFDPDGFRLMYDAARDFVQSLRDGIAPPLDGSDQTYQTVRALHPEIDRGEQHDLTAELADRFLDAKRAKDAADYDYRRTSSEVLDAMGQAQHAYHPDGYRIAYRTARGDSAPFLVADKQALTQRNAA